MECISLKFLIRGISLNCALLYHFTIFMTLSNTCVEGPASSF